MVPPHRQHHCQSKQGSLVYAKKPLGCPQKVKEQLYFALVRPHLEFACAVWDPFTNTDIQRLEMIQHKAARFVTKNYSRAPGSITKILEQLQWPTLEQRRKQCRLRNMYKIQTEPQPYPYRTILSVRPPVAPDSTIRQNSGSWKPITMSISTAFFHEPFLTGTNSHQMFSMPQVLKASKQLFQTTFNLSVTL